MTKPQLGSLTNFNSTANTVLSESSNLDANLWNIGIPLLDIDSGVGGLPGSENIALLPKRRIIIVSGEFIGDEATLRSFVNEIETELKSATQAQKQYTSSINKTYNVKLNNFTFNIENSRPDRILSYSLEMFTET